MKLSKISIAIAASLFSSVLHAGEPSITISGRDQVPLPKITVHSRFDFDQMISLKVRPDPRFVPSEVLIETVSKLGMVDATGVSITSGFDIDVQHDAVIGFSGGTAEIIRTARLPNGALQVISSFKDKNGNYVSPKINQIAAYNTGGKKLCFEYQTVEQAPPKTGFVLLVDRSGSMEPVIEEVREATAGFLRSLPAASWCAVHSFSSTWTSHTAYFQKCNKEDFKLELLQANGGSDLYSPLIGSYKDLSQPFFDDAQKAVIMITDGNVGAEPNIVQQSIAAKKGILTFAYFLGDKPQDNIAKGLIDAYVHNPTDITKNLQSYFHSLSQAYKAQKVLTVKECSAGGAYVP